jgi:hypothetical protein
MSDERKPSFSSLVTYHSSLPRIDKKHHADDYEEERFELQEVLQVEAARVVACDGVEREGSEEQTARKPDYLSLPIPHALL